MESLLCPCTSIKQVLHLYKSSSVCVLRTKHKATSYAVRKMISENGFSDNQLSNRIFFKHPFLSSQLIKIKKAIKK